MRRSTRNTPVILGLTGERCGGKSTAAAYLRRRYHVGYVRFSDTLVSILNLLHLDPRATRNMQKLGEGLRAAFGAETLARIVEQEAQALGKPLVVIDGMRKLGELRYLRRQPNFRLLYVTAPVALRQARSSKRKFRREDGISLSEFKRLEHRAAERDIPKVGRQADFRIDNTGTTRALHQKLDAVVTTITRPRHLTKR